MWSTDIPTKIWILLRYDMCPCYLKATDMWPWSVSSGVGIQGATGCHCGGVKSWSHQQSLSLGCDAFQAAGGGLGIWFILPLYGLHGPKIQNQVFRLGGIWSYHILSYFSGKGLHHLLDPWRVVPWKFNMKLEEWWVLKLLFLLAAKTCCGVGKKSVFQTLSSKWCWTPFSNMLTPNW